MKLRSNLDLLNENNIYNVAKFMGFEIEHTVPGGDRSDLSSPAIALDWDKRVSILSLSWTLNNLSGDSVTPVKNFAEFSFRDQGGNEISINPVVVSVSTVGNVKRIANTHRVTVHEALNPLPIDRFMMPHSLRLEKIYTDFGEPVSFDTIAGYRLGIVYVDQNTFV